MRRHDVSPGDAVAGYRIVSVLGEGGMGVVFLAEDVALHRRVALKVIAPELAADERFRERFLAESELAASLDHPNVVPVFEAGAADGLLFIAMRYVEGGDLRAVLESGPLDPRFALDVCAAVGRALDAAHGRGLVHRDVKPSNVLVDTAEGVGPHVYLADFGLTRRLNDPRSGGGAAGFSIGTPSYVSPEEIEGAAVGGTADVYSLGCLLFECLLGEPPFPRDSDVAVLFAHLAERPPSLHERMPELPSSIDHVVGRALAKAPADRYASCAELVEEARDALLAERPRARGRRAALGAAALLSVAGAVGALTLAATRSDRAHTEPASESSVVRIDPSTRRVVGRAASPAGPSVLGVGNDVWLASRGGGTVGRIDARTGAFSASGALHGPAGEMAVAPPEGAFSGEAPLVTSGPLPSAVALFDGSTGKRTAEVQISRDGFLGVPRIARGVGGIWLTTGDRHVVRLDKQHRRLAPLATLAGPQGERADSVLSAIAAGYGRLWVAGDPLDPVLWRLDPARAGDVDRLPLPSAPTDVAVGGGAVWVTAQLDDVLLRVDPRTGRVTDRIPVGRGPSAVAVGAGAVWVANRLDETLSRVDTRTLAVETVAVGGVPDDVAFGNGSVWASVQKHARPPSTDEAVDVGLLVNCDGSFGFLAASSAAGAELPLLRRGARLRGTDPMLGVTATRVAGRTVRLSVGCSDGTAATIAAEARRLVEGEHVDVLVAGDWPGESLVLRRYARRHPEVTFVSGISAGQELTLVGPAPNLFRFYVDGAQATAGLGSYAYHRLGWRRAVVVRDAAAFDYAQAAGFVAEFCSLGGRVVDQVVLPPGAPASGRTPPRLPDADGYAVMAVPDIGLRVVEALPGRGSLARRLVGGLLMGFEVAPPALGRRLDGVLFADSPGLGGGRPAWNAFVRRFKAAFPGLATFAGFPNGMTHYDAMEATLRALERVGGDVSDGQRRFRSALASTRLDAPEGRLSLDSRRQAIGSSFLLRHRLEPGGRLSWQPYRTVAGVEQTFNGYFRPDRPVGSGGRISCRPGTPPPWATRG